MPGSWFLTPSSHERKKDPLGEAVESKAGAERHTMSPEHPAGTEGTNVFRKQSRHGSQPEGAAEVGRLEQQKQQKGTWDWSIKKIMNARNSTQILTND